MVDDNVFIYTQPGNGKINTKDPLKYLGAAQSKLKEILDVLNAL